ncbi:MAG: hypothetical protein OHK0053_15360 [Microscillaceae bacterium]
MPFLVGKAYGLSQKSKEIDPEGLLGINVGQSKTPDKKGTLEGQIYTKSLATLCYDNTTNLKAFGKCL